MTNNQSYATLADALNAAAGFARVGAKNFAPTSQKAIVANATADLLALAAKFSRQGIVNPVEHITRLVDLGAAMNEAKSAVDFEADKKFGAQPLIASPDTDGEWPDEPIANARRSTTPPPPESPDGAGI